MDLQDLDCDNIIPTYLISLFENESSVGVFNVITAIVNSLYPEAPDALHDRLDDIFNKMDDLKESERYTLMAILYTVSQKHPEVFPSIHLIMLTNLNFLNKLK